MATTGTKATKSQCASCFTDAAVDNVASLSSIRRVLFATIFGDAMHNFADGVFIATAFKVCSPAVGWAVVLGTVAHELAQELADFLVLTNLCNLKPAVALGINFASGTTVLVGAIVVLAADLSERTVGMLLAFGAGLYIYTAAVECVPRLIGEAELRIKMTGVGFFALGAVAIGLVLIGHEHCD